MEVRRNGHVYSQSYRRGDPLAPVSITGDAPASVTGTKQTYLADSEIFDSVDYNYETIAARMRELAFLNKGVSITVTDEREGMERSERFCYEGGIVSFVEYLNINKEVLHRPPIYFETKKEEEGGEQNASIEITMQYNDG